MVEPIHSNVTPLHQYETGTWGPPAAERLVARYGGWRNPVVLLLEGAHTLLGNDQIQQELREQLPKDEEPADIERRYPVRHHDLVADQRQTQRDHQVPRRPSR
ncbi:MAG: hypothetical protein M3021_12705 [Actinomycetota bacterium]|nr:hypothetical protein [Actinomycetota bacterium]